MGEYLRVLQEIDAAKPVKNRVDGVRGTYVAQYYNVANIVRSIQAASRISYLISWLTEPLWSQIRDERQLPIMVCTPSSLSTRMGNVICSISWPS